ncbi:hypothetical protein TI10_10405 [Photorhabdus luminescens subsp. luminescens]|nr:hypothetical protein TI10_10405 [Photorhabdus luminescens subsp. luminescens]
MRHIAIGTVFTGTGDFPVVISMDFTVPVTIDPLFMVVFNMPVSIMLNMGGQIFLPVQVNLFLIFCILKAQLIKTLTFVSPGLKRGSGLFSG